LFEFQTTINNNQQIKIKKQNQKFTPTQQIHPTKYQKKIKIKISMHPYIFYSQHNKLCPKKKPSLTSRPTRGAERFCPDFGAFVSALPDPRRFEVRIFSLKKNIASWKNRKELESFLDFFCIFFLLGVLDWGLKWMVSVLGL